MQSNWGWRQPSLSLRRRSEGLRVVEGFAAMRERLVCEERLRPESPGTKSFFPSLYGRCLEPNDGRLFCGNARHRLCVYAGMLVCCRDAPMRAMFRYGGCSRSDFGEDDEQPSGTGCNGCKRPNGNLGVNSTSVPEVSR